MRPQESPPSANAPATDMRGSSTEGTLSWPVSIRIFFHVTYDIVNEGGDEE